MNQKSNQLPTQLVLNQSKRPITELIGAIAKTEQNMKNDLDNYMQTKKITHIESLNKNIEKLLLLKTLTKENYNLAFNQ